MKLGGFLWTFGLLGSVAAARWNDNENEAVGGPRGGRGRQTRAYSPGGLQKMDFIMQYGVSPGTSSPHAETTMMPSEYPSAYPSSYPSAYPSIYPSFYKAPGKAPGKAPSSGGGLMPMDGIMSP